MQATRKQQSAGSRLRPRRKASLYVAVLGVTLIVSMIGLSAMQVAHLQLRSARTGSDRRETRLLAASAIEHAVAEFNTNSNWQTDYVLDTEYPTKPVAAGGGTFTWKLVDVGSGQLRLDGIGRVGEAQCILSVDLETPASLDGGLLVGGNLTVDASNSITVNGAPLVCNGTVNNSGTITADVEAQSITGAGTITGTQTAPAAARNLPKSQAVLDYYTSLGTAITPPGIAGGEIYEALLSPFSNPYGVANTHGVYVIDASGGQVEIRWSRIVGTIVVINLPPGESVVVRNNVNWEPAYPDFPALIVDGNLKLQLAEPDLNESTTWDPNYNPAGTPYQGESDTDEVDTYPSTIAGLIYCTGDLTFKSPSTRVIEYQGLAIAAGNCAVTGALDASLEYDAAFAAAPVFARTVTTGPTEVRGYNTTGNAQGQIQSDQRWGQYFKPNLPADAISWRVTSVDVRVVREGSPGNFEVGLYRPDGANMPDVLLEEVSVPGSNLGWNYDWYNVPFTAAAGLSPNQGLCLTLTSSQSVAPAYVRYRDSGVSEPDAGMLTGNAGGWTTYDPGGSLRYRIYAEYTTIDGTIRIVPGSWRQTPIP